jgi:hypothetical protein
MRKHQYSASVCAKSVFPIVPNLDDIMQYFMLFPMMYSKLGHKLTNVKTARINKVLIAFVHRITHRKHLYSPGLYAESVCAIVPKLDYIVQFFMLFQRCSVHCGTSSQASKSQGLIRANYFFAYIKCQTTEFTMRKHQYSASVCAKSLFPIVPKLDYIMQYFIVSPMMYRKLRHNLTNVKTASINKVLITFFVYSICI